MDVSPEGALLRYGVANAEVRATQAQLYESIIKQTVTLDTLKTHKYLLDLDIKIGICLHAWNIERPLLVDDKLVCGYVSMIKTGFCNYRSCEEGNILGKRVVGLRLIHILALNDKNLPLIAYLHECGCDMNPLTLYSGTSPLLFAVKSGSIEIVKYYVQHFDSVQFAPTVQNALIESHKRCNIPEILKTLLSAKHIDVNVRSKDCTSLLVSFLLCNKYHGDDSIDHVRLYVEAGMDLEIVDWREGCTPLMIAAKYGCVQTVKLLLKHGSIVNTVNRLGNTAMHLAAVTDDLPFYMHVYLNDLPCLDENKAKIVKLLLEHGANPETPNKQGATPLWYAVYKDRFEVVQTLLAASVKMDIKLCRKKGYPPPKSLLEVALKEADTDIIILLWEAGYNIQNQTDILSKEKRHYRYHSKCGDSFYQSVIDDWITASQSPRTLESLCRAQVRRCLGYRIHRKVEQLDIPMQIKNSLLFKDILPTQRRLDDRVVR